MEREKKKLNPMLIFKTKACPWLPNSKSTAYTLFLRLNPMISTSLPASPAMQLFFEVFHKWWKQEREEGQRNHHPLFQVIFYWAYVTRHICCWFDSNPHLRPVLHKSGGSEHQIVLSKSQQDQVYGVLLFAFMSIFQVLLGQIDYPWILCSVSGIIVKLYITCFLS